MIASARVILGVCLLGISGCGASTPDRVAVSGKVTYKGQPIDDGEIVLVPQETGQLMATTKIKDGEYKIDPGHGPSPGAYSVRILGYRETGRKLPPSPYLGGESSSANRKIEQFVPARFNTKTTLSIVIDPEKENRHDFQIP